MFKDEEYSSSLNIFICLVLKHDSFTSFISLFIIIIIIIIIIISLHNRKANKLNYHVHYKIKVVKNY